MDETQLRALIRDVVARHLAEANGPAPPPAQPAWKTHASHQLLPVLAGQENDGPCVIEPSVKCHHCAFCQSLGH